MDWIKELIIPAIEILIAGGMVWYFRFKTEAIRREKEKLQDERRKIYVQALAPYIRLFAGIHNRQETKKAMAQALSFEHRKVSFELYVTGSDDVVRSFNDFMQYCFSVGDKTEADSKAVLTHWGKILISIRRDLGNKKTKLKEKDMLKGWVKDIDKLMK